MREQATVTLHKLLSGKIYIHPVGFKKHLFTFKNKFFKEKKQYSQTAEYFSFQNTFHDYGA